MSTYQRPDYSGFFHFYSKDNVWTRIIKHPNNYKYEYIEVNLTPSPFVLGSSWEKSVAPIIIKSVFNVPDKDDKFPKELPATIYLMMVEKLGYKLTDFILRWDILKDIHLPLLSSVGKPYADLIKLR